MYALLLGGFAVVKVELAGTNSVASGVRPGPREATELL